MMTDTFMFEVATELEYYGDEATDQDVENYAEFARTYLEGLGYTDVETEHVDHYDSHEPEENHQLREKVWDAFCRN